jgi:hypothetical protein
MELLPSNSIKKLQLPKDRGTYYQNQTKYSSTPKCHQTWLTENLGNKKPESFISRTSSLFKV